MPTGLRAPAGVERDATIAALLKKVREQAIELAELTDSLQMAKDHGQACEQRIAELLSTSLGLARGSPSRSTLLERQSAAELANSPMPTRSPRSVLSHADLSVARDELRKVKQSLADTQAVLAQTKGTMEEYGRKNKLLEGHLRKKTGLLLSQTAQLEEAGSEVERLEQEKEYLTRSSQPSNLRRLNKSAAAVATANSHLLQDELRRLKAALKRAEHSQLLGGQREKVLLDSLKKAEERLAQAPISPSGFLTSSAKSIGTQVGSCDEDSSRKPGSVTPAIKATAYIRSTSPVSVDSLAHEVEDGRGHNASACDADSLDAIPQSDLRKDSKAQVEVDRLRADNERLLQLCEHVQAGVQSVDHVLEGGSYAWSELSKRVQKSEALVSQMDLYIKSITGTGFKATGNEISGSDFDDNCAETDQGDTTSLRNSVNRLQGLLRQAEQERNMLVDYLSSAKEEKETLSAQLSEVEGRHSALMQVQHNTTQEHADYQRELLDLGKAKNDLAGKCIQIQADAARVRSRLTEVEHALSEKTAEAASLSKETEELSQMQLKTLMALRDSREKNSQYEAELTKLSRAVRDGSSPAVSPTSSPVTLSVSSASGVNIQLLQAKLTERERKFESTVKELATMRGHYDELRPRYQKLEARSEEQELRIRTLVEELLLLRPLKENLARLGDEVSPLVEQAAQHRKVSRSHSQRDAILFGGQAHEASGDNASVAPAEAVPDTNWVTSPSLNALSPPLQMCISRLAGFAIATSKELGVSQKSLDAAQVRLGAEADVILSLRAQVQVLQEQAQNFGAHAMSSVKQFSSQLHSSETENNARIRELEKENCQLLRCRETLDHLKYVVASSGGSGNKYATTGMALLKSHLPRLIDLSPAPTPEAPSRRDVDSEDDVDSADSIDQERIAIPSGSSGANSKHPNRYLVINSPGRARRLRQVHAVNDQGAAVPNIPPMNLPQPYPAENAIPAPGINDLDIILAHFTDSMLSEVVGRAMLSLDGSLRPLGTGARTVHDEDVRVTNRLKRQLAHKVEECRQQVDELARKSAEYARLEATVSTLQGDNSVLVKEKKRLASELEEVLSLSEKQQVLSSVQDGKLAGYKKEKALKVAQINSLQQRDSAIKARLLAALRNFSGAGALVASVYSLLGQASSTRPLVDFTPSAFNQMDRSPHNMHALGLSPDSALDRSTDMVQAIVDITATLWKCVATIGANMQIREVSQNVGHQHQHARQEVAGRWPQPENKRVDESPNITSGISLKQNVLSPSRKGVPDMANPLPVVAPSKGRLSGSGVSFDIASEGASSTAPTVLGGVPTESISTEGRGNVSLLNGTHYDVPAVGKSQVASLGVSGNSATSLSLLTSSSSNHQGGNGQFRADGQATRRPVIHENHVHSDNVVGLQSPATNLQNRLKDAKSKFANLRENWA